MEASAPQKNISGFKIMKMAVQQFMFLRFFWATWGQNLQKFGGGGERLFLQKEGQGRSKVTTFHGT